ncbi:Spy0128 family protein, partial [Streptococcus salivarius]|uniref:Spy0128 family protein n=1 Tax=Streptococcus salivarius TaxID=1304 RepID=UPI002B75C267
MKDIFNRRQRFSLRKYSFGVASVLLGTALFAAHTAQADEVTAPDASSSNPGTSVEGESSSDLVETSTASTAQADPTAAVSSTEATASTFNLTPEASTTDKAAAETTDKQATETAKPEAAKPASEAAKPTEKATSEAAKPAAVASTNAASNNVETTASTTAASNASTTAANRSAATAAPVAEETAAAETAAATTSLNTRGSARFYSVGSAAVRSATLDRAATDMTNGGALAMSRSRRNRRAATDHNNEPVAVATFLKDGEVATPDMTDPNGASVASQTVPAGYQAKEGDFYTYAIWDLTEFNKRYNTKYYARAYKRFDDSTDTTVELLDKNTGSVVETRTVTASSGVQKFTTTTAASNSQLTFQVDYKAGTAPSGKKAEPFIQNGYEVGKSITDLVAAGHKLTEAERALYTAVYNARTTTDIINVVEPAYNGRTITDSNAKIPVTINKTTYYKVVDKNNPTFNANKTDKTVQDYKENGNEVELARYTLKAEEGQRFTASGERQFDGYKLYQTADANDQSGTVSRPYTVGTKFMDADRYGIKRIKEVVGEDGSVVIRVYLLDPRQQSKRSDGSLSTDGYMLLAETKPIKPGEWNSQDLVVKKSPLYTIAHTVTDEKTGAKTNYPNGKEVPFDFQKASGYAPYHSVFVPFLGDGIGHGSANSQLERGVGGIGTNVDLLNTLTPYKQPIYYYVKQEPVTVTPEVEKQLEGRVLVDGEFSFKIKEVNENKSLPSYEETVTNKNGKATFSNLTFNKVGTYIYTITETAGSDANVDYDAMTVTMTVTVTENSKGDLQASVKYSGAGGFASSATDKIFNNYVVAPVKTRFDFSKALAGRELKAGEFSFVLKDSTGKVLQTKTNTKEGVVAFDDLTFDNTQVGTHKYTVEEVQGSEAGMQYDTMKAEVTITVTKEGHVLKATNTLPADTEFNNTFTPAATQAQFRFTKRLEGKTLEANAFTFELLENGNVIQTKQNMVDGSIQFDPISYATVGTHTYTVREKAGTDTNIDYDSMNAVVTVNVTKDAQTGLLNAAVTMPADTEFNNFVVAPVKTKFDFSKALAGRELKAGEFSFVLKDSTGKVLQTKTNTKEGVVAFDDLTFDNTQVGTHKYTVEEVIPENKEAGMTYDTMKAEVTITVTKEGHVLKATNTLPADTEFNNTFTPAATQAQFKFTKKLEGKELTKDAFTFELLENGKVIQTKKNAADGTIQFDAISYDKEGSHTYTVREVAGTDTNIDYDDMNAVVTVNVTKDAASGILTANVTMPEDTEFNNFAVAPVKTRFDFSKALAGRELKAGEFSFVLKDSTGKVLQTKTNTKEGVVAFDDLTFDNTQVGTHKYTVEEVQGSEAGMQYDTMKAEVTITVTKEGHVLKATNTLPTDTEFNNTFTSAPTQAQFKFTKRLEGKALEADAFTFELLENGNVIQTKKNAADGSITFDAIEYSAEGEHTYTVREKAGNDTNIDYDTMNAVVKVKVTKDAATGLLSTAVTMPEDTEFNNYVVSPVVTKFDFTKKLAGRELKAGEFSFVLKDAAGKVVETVKNDAAGNVTFSELSFDNTKVGTHTYTVEEVIPENKEFGMTYDQMKATVTVEVAKNGHTLTTVTNVTSTGGVDANGNATDGTADKEFNNKVTPPNTPEFQPEKFVVSKEKYDITGDKLMDDDDDVPGNEYTATNANPYVDGVANNEPENLNTKTVKRGSKLVYQVWLDTTKFTEANNVQYVGVSDTYDADKLDVNASDIKAYDSVTGADVTAKFDIKVENGTITATSKDEFIKDKVNNPVIDTTKFAFGRYYKFDIPATVKESVKAGADIENTANQTVHVYNPVSKTVEKPNKPTQKRVNSVPVPVEMNFTKRLEGRELQANEFEFVLKKDGVEVERVKNDAAGKIVFKTLEFGRDDLGKTYNYTVEETPGTDTTVKYDTMVATVKVVVSHDGTAKAIVANVTDAADKEFNNRVTPPEEPKFQPEKYVVSKAKFDITGTKLVDDDSELTDKYGETNTNPYVDNTNNNEDENLNTKSVERGSKLYYQVWLDTTKFDAANKDNIQTVGITDNYDKDKLTVNASEIKVYDSVTGADVTNKFDISDNNGVLTANLKAGFTKSLGDAENTQIIDTTKFEFGRYYKFDIPATVKDDVVAGADIENKAAQVVNYYNPVSKTVEKPNKPTEKRVNSVPISVEFNFTKKLEGRDLKAGEFTFELKDSDNVVIATATNDAAGKIKFSPVEYTNKAGKTVTALKYQKGQEGTYKYTVTEVKGTDATVTYDEMAAVVTVTVSHDGTAKALITNVTDPADKEFNNRVTPPEEPKFQPEKYVVSEEKFDITGDKLVDDDKELADKYADTNANPYADDASNNEAQNLNTKTVKRGDKLVYQVWLDTTKFDAANKDNIQSVGISDDYDETKLNLDATKIKAYDSVTGDDVTAKFDITVNNGVITATLKDGFTKSLGDAENTQVIDTTKFAFGRYYKFDIPTTVKADVPGGVDIENTAAQVVNYYNPTTKKVEKPNKPTEKRVNNVPVEVEFNFTKRLEGRELKANEFSFVLKDSEGKTLETVSNDASGNVKFSKLEFKKGQEGVHNYTVEEVKGSDATVTYDTMKANVTVTVKHDGTAKVLIATVGDIADKEFNNRVTPPEEPKFQPEKYVVSEEKFDITGDKLVDDDKELADKYADTNANPYADDASNNEAQNLNTKTVKRGDKLVYQVWLDTTKFDAANKDNIQSVGISDDYDETKLDLDATKIKAYDSVTGDDVTAKFDITVNNGVITATLKDGFTKSLGDAENTQVIDTTKFAFGRYYKFDIPTTVKADVKGGVDIENTAAQVVNYYNPTTKKVEKPSKPTEKR